MKLNTFIFGRIVLAMTCIATSAPAANVDSSAPLAPVAKTEQTQSYAAGDDGALQKGVALPRPRFTDNGDGTVTDNKTQLVWLKDTSGIPSGTNMH